MVGSTFSDLMITLDFWRGVGKFLVICLLVVVMYLLVMAYSGNRVRWHWRWPWDRSSGAGQLSAHKDESTQAAADEITGGSTGVAADTSATTTTSAADRRSAHLDLLATLRTSLRYQGSTVALIVFAVLILGIDHVLGGSEVATILSGIAGYVLGAGRSQQSGVVGPDPTGDPPGKPKS